MKRYRKVMQDNKHTGEVLVQVFKQANEEDCCFCKALKGFISDFDAGKFPPDFPKQIRNLGTGNLKAHLKSGKHWAFVDEYFIKSTR